MSYAVASPKDIRPTKKWLATYERACNASAAKQSQEAESLFRKCARKNPELWLCLADKACKEKRYMESLHMIADALEYAKEPVTRMLAFNNLGLIWTCLGQPDKGIKYIQQSMAIRQTPAALVNLSTATAFMGDFDQACKWTERALELDPKFSEALFQRSFQRIRRGDWEGGWEDYETRFKTGREKCVRLKTGLPEWTDRLPKPGGHLLVYCEQGTGDTVMISRFAPMLKRNYGFAELTLAPQKGLKRLLSLVDGWDYVREAGDDYPPGLNWQISSMSLPRALKITPATVPQAPYIRLKNVPAHAWEGNGRIGLCWQGSLAHMQDWTRSIKLEQFRPIYEMPPWRFVSMQVGFGEEQIGPLGLDLPGIVPAGGDYLDTAIALCSLDALVTVDTSVAHIAGAMGIPVIMLVGASPDFRWGTGDQTEWYPSIRIVRQKRLGDWSEAIAEARQLLVPLDDKSR